MTRPVCRSHNLIVLSALALASQKRFWARLLSKATARHGARMANEDMDLPARSDFKDAYGLVFAARDQPTPIAGDGHGCDRRGMP